jgi:hypothetical protein
MEERKTEIKLTEEHMKAIEKILNCRGHSEVIVKFENGKGIVILQSYKKRVI